MCNRVLPDFVEWAKNITDRDELAEALEQAYTQGYSAGALDAEENWWIEQDAEYAAEENN